MYDEFAAGGLFPRPEDHERLSRYAQARYLFEGEHAKSKEAQRIKDKLATSREFTRWQGYSAEGTVWFTYNLPRLIVQKFADLQVLNTPVVLLEDEALQNRFLDDLKADIPDLWARIHYAKQLQRALGDVGLSVAREADGGPVDVRVVDPERWYPVLDANDPYTIVAHQCAWLEEHEDGKQENTYLRVDVCYPNRVERRAFLLEGKGVEFQSSYEIKRQVPLSLHWDGMAEVVEDDVGELPTFVHMGNGWLSPDMPFGRPEFLDSAGLVDNVSWRLSSWSDANDRVAHAPEVIPEAWLTQDENGTVIPPSQYRRRFTGGSAGRLADVPEPRYMEYPLSYETLEAEFDAAVTALLIRHEMSPALLGLQFGREKESGEAKSLGMGTTEAATRRDLLQTQPKVDRVLTLAARLKGLRDVDVSTHWRVGLPKTQAELMQEMQQLKSMGLVTRQDMLEALYPWLKSDQIEAKLAELDTERQAEIDAFSDEPQAEMG